MKKIFFPLVIAVLFLLGSCGKDKKTPYGKNITGLNLTNLNAQATGSIGVDDSNTSSDSFALLVYPIPSVTEMNVALNIYNTTPITITAKIVNVLFPGAPPSYTYENTNITRNVVIENSSAAGTVALTQSQNLGVSPPYSAGSGIQNVSGGGYKGQFVQFKFDVSSLPQGFYRVYIETSDGKSFWMNSWVARS